MKNLCEFPRVPLGLFPTPLHRLNNLSEIFGKNIYIKRDDLCGVALGGNKVRKLEFLLADALKQGADTVMTTGQAQSNHAMLTAACAGKLGMKTILMLKKRGVCDSKGNQILNRMLRLNSMIPTAMRISTKRWLAAKPTLRRKVVLPMRFLWVVLLRLAL